LSLRARSGVSFFDRRFDGKKLRSFMNRPGTITGLLVDQHAGGRGLRLPFFGLPCSVSPSPALFALRYNLCLHCCFCRRLGLGRWEIEVGPKIGTVCGGSPRAFEDILMDINRHFEAFILEDPANWFWVHDRWKLSGRSFSTG
jgi:KDO2-lipid IV(A) lauroyltransferase